MLGRPAAHWRELDLGKIRAVASINGSKVGEGVGAEAMGHPLDAVAWIAGHLASRGHGLLRKDVVITGSIITSKFVKAGDYDPADVRRLAVAGDFALYAFPAVENGHGVLCTSMRNRRGVGGGGCGRFLAGQVHTRPPWSRTTFARPRSTACSSQTAPIGYRSNSSPERYSTNACKTTPSSFRSRA